MVRCATFGGGQHSNYLVRELDTYIIRWRCCQATRSRDCLIPFDILHDLTITKRSPDRMRHTLCALLCVLALNLDTFIRVKNRLNGPYARRR